MRHASFVRADGCRCLRLDHRANCAATEEACQGNIQGRVRCVQQQAVCQRHAASGAALRKASIDKGGDGGPERSVQQLGTDAGCALRFVGAEKQSGAASAEELLLLVRCEPWLHTDQRQLKHSQQCGVHRSPLLCEVHSAGHGGAEDNRHPWREANCDAD